MADKAIAELVAASQITATDMFVLEQNGTAKKLTGQILLNWLTAAADGHGGIQTIEKLSTSGLADTYRITLADTTFYDFVVTNGRGIKSITKTSTSGLMDTYTISYNDGTTSTFTVTNGEKGDKGDNAYIWVKFASQQPTASSNSFGDVPDDWIGIYFGGLAEAPTDWQQYIWYKIKGEKGDTGDPATLINATVTYQVGDTGTIIPSGAWTESIPAVAQGKYLWTRMVQQFNTGSPITAYTVSRMGLDGLGSVVSVAGVSPDESGNVALTAADIRALSIAGGDMEGPINMNGQPLSGLNAPTANDHAANMGYVNEQVKKAAPRNLLDNSDFTNPVNQRGAASYNANSYGIDRWKSLTGPATLTVNEGYITIAANGDTQARFRQHLLPGMLKSGKIYTIAIKTADGNIICAKGTVGDMETVAQANVDFGYIGLFNNTANGETIFQIYLNVGASADIVWAALYEGEYTIETLPEYQSKGYAVELLACQRYFVRYGNANENNHIGWAQAATTTVANAVLALSQPMKISKPTITVSGTLVLRNGVTDITVTSVAANSFASGPFGYMAMNAEGMTSGTTFAVRLVLGTLDVSADL